MSPTLTRDKMIIVATCVLLYFGNACSQTTPASTEHLSDLNHRLPDSVRPIHYDLYMNPLMGQKSFNGNVKILINVTRPVSRIVLHSKNLNIHRTKLVTAEGNVPVPIKESYPYEAFEYWITELEDKTPAGLYEISMEFDSNPSDDNKGFYQVSYKPKGAKDEKWVASAKFEPTYARAAYPCFDEPALKATYSIKVQHPNTDEYHALSNMDIEKVTDFGNYSVTTFKRSVPMSTYLVCFVVSDFGYRSIQIEPKQFGHSFEMRVYAEKNSLNRTQLALEIGKKITEFFTDYFGIPYALPKLDMIAIPDFQPSALETWGLITYRDRILFYDENDVSFQMKETSGAVIAHELAHMWFGNLVTMCWWSDIWLNEAFASFMLYKGLNHAYPEWKVDDLFIVNEVYNALKFDASPASHPIIQDATDPDSIFALFDSVTYQKGSSVLRMLENVVGPDNFQSAVTNYLKKYVFGNAETDDFVNEIARAVPHIEVKELMATWTQQMGYPVLNVMKFEDGMYVLTQKRFFSNPDNALKKYNDSVFDYKWIIPVTYFSSEDTSCKLVWMDRTDNEVIIDVPGAEWVKFNKDHIGFYRVNYPRVMWMKFANVMMQNRSKFSTLDRSSLFGDAFSLADSSQLAYDIPLELSKSLENETDQVIWFLGGNELGKIMHLLDGEEMVAFKKFGAKIVKMAYEKVGWKVYTDDYEANYQYAILRFACRMELEDCVSRANQEFSAWMENPEMKPNPNLRSIIFETSLKHVNDTEVWNKVWQRYVNEEEPHLRRTYLHALGATKTDSLLQEYLRRAENETNVRRHDYFDVVREISSSDPDLAWQYVRENWKQIVDRFGLSDPELANLIPIISNRFCTEDKLSELEQFIQQYPDAGSGVLARQKAVQQVRSNIKWRENNMDSISDWLRRNEFL